MLMPLVLSIARDVIDIPFRHADEAERRAVKTFCCYCSREEG